MGNNREVARLYSERLGYTVNESTVRGIKKRYLEVVHHPGSFRPPLFTFQTLCFFLSSSFISTFTFTFTFPSSSFLPPCRACTRGRSALPEFLPEPREVMRTVGKQVTENFTFDLEKNNKMEFDVKKTRWHWCKIKNNMVMLWNPRRRRRGGWRGWVRQPKRSAWRRYETAAGGAWRWDHALCPGIFFPFLMTIVLCLWKCTKKDDK